MNVIQRYYIHSLAYSKSRFVVELVSISIILKLVLGFLGVIGANTFGIPLIEMEEDLSYPKEDTSFLLFFLVFLAPFTETFTQWIPIKLLKTVTTNYVFVIGATAIIFASLHLSYSAYYALIMLPLGIALSWSFYCKYKKSLAEAFLITFSIHALHNMSSAIFILI